MGCVCCLSADGPSGVTIQPLCDAHTPQTYCRVVGVPTSPVVALTEKKTPLFAPT